MRLIDADKIPYVAAITDTFEPSGEFYARREDIAAMPTIELEPCEDAVSRQYLLDAFGLSEKTRKYGGDHSGYDTRMLYEIQDVIEDAPPAQPTVHPQRTCVNCGRTVNNGGWYADGGTRCPIEEHYALPKDGYCHLWEKRNVTDDDYPERRKE